MQEKFLRYESPVLLSEAAEEIRALRKELSHFKEFAAAVQAYAQDTPDQWSRRQFGLSYRSNELGRVYSFRDRTDEKR